MHDPGCSVLTVVMSTAGGAAGGPPGTTDLTPHRGTLLNMPAFCSCLTRPMPPAAANGRPHTPGAHGRTHTPGARAVPRCACCLPLPTGLTLTVASTAFIMEPAFNPGLEAQAAARIYRLGAPSFVFDFV